MAKVWLKRLEMREETKTGIANALANKPKPAKLGYKEKMKL